MKKTVILLLTVLGLITGTAMAADEHVPNIALGKNTKMYSVDGLNLLPPTAPGGANPKYSYYAVDGDVNTLACAGGNWNWMLEIDLGETYEKIKDISIIFAQNSYPVNFDILLADADNNFTSVVHDDSLTEGGKYEYTIEPKNARYIRIRDNKAQTDIRQMHICEVEVYQDASAIDPNDLIGEMKSTGFSFIDSAGRKQNLSNICSGIITNSRYVKTFDDTDITFISALYDKSTGKMCKMNKNNILSSSEGCEETVDLEVSKELTGLPAGDVEKGENLALGATARFLSNSDSTKELPPNGPGDEAKKAEYAVDGDMNTIAGAGDEWAYTLEISLPESRTIGQAVITFAEDSYPLEFDILTSEDGSFFSVVKEVKNNTAAGTYTYNFKPTTAKYIRIRDNVAQTLVRQMNICEVELYNVNLSSDYEIRSFMVNNGSEHTPFFRDVDVLSGDSYEVKRGAVPNENIPEYNGEIQIDADGMVTVNNIDCAQNAPFVVWITKNDEILYCNMIVNNEYGDTLKVPISGLELEDMLTVELFGAISAKSVLKYDELLFWDVLTEKMNKSAEENVLQLLSDYNTYIKSERLGELSGFTGSEKSKLISAVLNNNSNGFGELKALIDDTIKNIIDARAAKPSGGSGSSGGGRGVSSPSTGVNVTVPKSESFTDTELPKTAKKIPFDDLDGTEWARESIQKLFELNIINGVSETKFMPDKSVTRAEFLKMLVLAFNLTYDREICEFTDVNQQHWAYPYIQSAVSSGLVFGYDGRFMPDELISRQDAATLLYRFCRYTKTELSKTDISYEFSDINDVGEYAREAVEVLGQAHIMQGEKDKTFMPENQCTRAMAAKMLYAVIGQ